MLVIQLVGLDEIKFDTEKLNYHVKLSIMLDCRYPDIKRLNDPRKFAFACF